MKHVLIVDDEPAICRGFEELLKADGHKATVSSSAEDAIDLVRSNTFDAMLLDVRLPGMDGLTAIPHIRSLSCDMPIIVMTAYGDLSTAVSAVEQGAFDYLPKPFELGDAQQVLRRALTDTRTSTTENNIPAAQAGGLIGASAPMQAVFRQIALAAQHDSPVLITGESGTGKELVASAIHANSNRSDRNFVPVHLASLNESLLERELFGHAVGAFTGADTSQQGLIGQADKGTLFLDEIGEAGQDIQVKLLRTIETGEFYPIGDSRRHRSDFRLICATNRSMAFLLNEDHFRTDLFHRIAAIHIQLPPLRERKDDIPRLAQYFLSQESAGQHKVFSDQALSLLQEREYRGNVRELRNLVVQCAATSGQVIHPEDIPAEYSESQPQSRSSTLADAARSWATRLDSDDANATLGDAMQIVESEIILSVVEACHGNKAEAARRLGIHRETLREKLKALNQQQ